MPTFIPDRVRPASGIRPPDTQFLPQPAAALLPPMAGRSAMEIQQRVFGSKVLSLAAVSGSKATVFGSGARQKDSQNGVAHLFGRLRGIDEVPIDDAAVALQLGEEDFRSRVRRVVSARFEALQERSLGGL